MFNFEVYAYLFEIKSKIPDFERGKAKILTTPVRSARPTGQAGIHGVFRGLKFEPDADIGQISADFERGRFEIGS